MGYIYVLKNKINDKMYVGQTIQNLDKRLEEYRFMSRKYNTRAIHNAIDKYGFDNFEIYSYCIPNNMLDYFEIEMIKNINTISPYGYNIESGGNKNKEVGEETRKKISKANKGKKRSEEFKKIISKKTRGENNPFYGKKHDEKTRIKMSKSHTGVKLSKEHAKAQLEARLKNGMWNKGKQLTIDHIKNISISKKGTKVSNKTKKILSSINNGKVLNNEHKRKIGYGNNPNIYICQYLNDKLINKFKSFRQASKIINLSRHRISEACKNKINLFGYSWKYMEIE